MATIILVVLFATYIIYTWVKGDETQALRKNAIERDKELKEARDLIEDLCNHLRNMIDLNKELAIFVEKHTTVNES